VRADEKLTVFLELEAATAAAERRAQTSAPTRFEKGINESHKRKLDAAFHAAVE
jgi:hypothetical protein